MVYTEEQAQSYIANIHNIRLVSESDRWKYLRENNTRTFTPKRHSTLSDYLAAIYPGTDFIFDQCVPKDVLVGRGAEDYHRYRPDARNEELSLIVEFDGVDHYTKTHVMLRDARRDSYFQSLGYRVVRIPYWLQLSQANIYYLFGVKLSDPMCELKFSFYDTEYHGMDVCIGGMCEFGRRYFMTQFQQLPRETRLALIDDIDAVRHYVSLTTGLPESAACPDEVFDFLLRTEYNLRNVPDDLLSSINDSV